MKILLTGATGFIGSHVARHLVRDGHQVHALIRPHSNLSRLVDIRDSLHFIEGDLLTSSLLARQSLGDGGIPHPSSFPLCLHLAWYVEPGKYLDSPLNEQYLQASLRLAMAGFPRIVIAGTCFEYDHDSRSPLQETSPTKPRSLYAACKLRLFEELTRAGVEFAWTRFFYQYGPHEDPRRLVPMVINSLLQGRPAKLTRGEQVRDFLHVEDVAAAVCAVATSRLTGAVNIGSGIAVTVRQIAEQIGMILGQRELIHMGDQPYAPHDPLFVLADNSTLVRGTNWKPRYGLEDGLRQTINWWQTRGASATLPPPHIR